MHLKTLWRRLKGKISSYHTGCSCVDLLHRIPRGSYRDKHYFLKKLCHTFETLSNSRTSGHRLWKYFVVMYQTNWPPAANWACDIPVWQQNFHVIKNVWHMMCENNRYEFVSYRNRGDDFPRYILAIVMQLFYHWYTCTKDKAVWSVFKKMKIWKQNFG